MSELHVYFATALLFFVCGYAAAHVREARRAEAERVERRARALLPAVLIERAIDRMSRTQAGHPQNLVTAYDRARALAREEWAHARSFDDDNAVDDDGDAPAAPPRNPKHLD